MPSTLSEEEFEDQYTDKFMCQFRHKGLVIHYERDRAATDIGMQLKSAPGSLELSGVRVWFQFNRVLIHSRSVRSW
jgi:hypothetical protein